MKTLAISLLLTLIVIETSAQLNVNRFGIRGAIQYTDWEGEKSIDNTIAYDGKVGYMVGIYSVREFNPHWSLEYGLNISFQGFKMNGQLIVPGVNIGADVTNHSAYIDVPVSIRYTFGELGPKGLYLSAGLKFSYLVFNKIDGNVVYNGTNYYGDPESNAEELNRFDLSIFPALGYQFHNGLNFQISYERGLINIVKDDDYLGLTKAYNSIIKLQVGIDL